MHPCHRQTRLERHSWRILNEIVAEGGGLDVPIRHDVAERCHAGPRRNQLAPVHQAVAYGR